MKHFFLLTLALLGACHLNQNKEKEAVPSSKEETAKDTLKTAYFKSWATDSLYRKKAKYKILLDLISRFEEADLAYKYTIDSVTSYVKVQRFFEDGLYYAIINSYWQGTQDWDIYKLTKDSMEYKLAASGYQFAKDTIFDVNGDGKKDFLVNHYPLSGCCRRNSYDVYLSPTSEKGLVTDYIDLINPTFYPKEHIIRGVDYGHPGEVGLYKAEWRGDKLEIVEYIYPDYTTKGKTFIRTHKHGIFPKRTEGIPLKALPKEYETVEDLDWFFHYEEDMFAPERMQQIRGDR